VNEVVFGVCGVVTGVPAFLVAVMRFIILYNQLIPISLYVSLEVVKLAQCIFFNSDLAMFHAKNGTPFRCRTTTLNEDLGQVSRSSISPADIQTTVYDLRSCLQFFCLLTSRTIWRKVQVHVPVHSSTHTLKTSAMNFDRPAGHVRLILSFHSSPSFDNGKILTRNFVPVFWSSPTNLADL
jgi:hypothetical protein